MKAFNPADLSPEALALAGMPAELITFLSLLGSIADAPADLCDCPPGVCLGEQDALNGNLNSEFDLGLARDSGDEDDLEDEEDDELEVVFDPDFDFDPIEMPQEDKVGAVAQLGRVIENMTVLVGIHADLLTKLVA
ncbi:hypothetical protein [Bradyrhizobium sp. DASA03007]|uniref:hypothetical protein n=1 Tax=unclassified Bradyrhizobium TaxID=2631580 RepID=UPI003F72E16F